MVGLRNVPDKLGKRTAAQRAFSQKDSISPMGNSPGRVETEEITCQSSSIDFEFGTVARGLN